MTQHKSIPDKTLETTWKLLADWEDTPNFDLLLNDLRQKDNSQVADMSATLCRCIFRNRTLIDWIINHFSAKKPRGRIFKLLRIAVAQLLIDQQVNEAIICDTTVRFCKNRFNRHEASFVNQFLHKVTSMELPKPPRNAALCLSPELLKQWNKHFCAKDIERWSELFKTPAPMTCRLRDTQTDISDLTEFLEELELPQWAGGHKMFKILNAKEFLKNMNGRFYIQDPAPLLSISLLDPKPGEIIGDFCAAPGGKSIIIAEKLQNSGQLFSCDASEKRLPILQENLGVQDHVTIKVNDARWPIFDDNSFDAVLLDVPCSNTGVIRRKADVRWTFSRTKLSELNMLQLQILNGSAKLMKSGGRIVYSTCSIDPEENMQIVEAFLAEHNDFTLAKSENLFPTELHDGAFAALIIRK